MRKVQGTPRLARTPQHLRATWSGRLALVADALGTPGSAPSADATALEAALGATIDLADARQVWLALATLSGTLPDDAAVTRATRAATLHGPAGVWEIVAASTTTASARLAVRVVHGGVVVDVNHTAATDLATGIQRVARETASRWHARSACLPVAWTEGFGALRDLTAAEHGRLGLDAASAVVAAGDEPGVVVPWQATVVIPELAAEHGRSDRLLALARWSGNRTGVIGFDCVPLTSAETAAEGFASVFYGNLAAVRHFDRVAAISGAAAQEYDGWRSMLGAVGLPGPEITSVLLPEEAPTPSDVDLAAARRRYVVGGLPLVLVVGSHEPRKNHLAVLHAAELRWRAGDRFALTFVGGNSWGSEEFRRVLADLQRAGRPVESVSRIPDAHLWALYRLARFTVFPSLNEGFGLPVAESLAAGTPVVTSSYGSMREIGEPGGALLVDPRDDHAIADAMGRLLGDDAVLTRLRAEAASRPRRTWDEYAAGVWRFLVEAPLDA